MSRQPENVIFLKENAYFENFSKKVLTLFFKVLYSFVLRTNRMNHPGEIQRQTDPEGSGEIQLQIDGSAIERNTTPNR